MKQSVTPQIYLSEFSARDKADLVEHLNDRQIYECTLRIPYPYRESDAERWLALVDEQTEREGQSTHWAIRDSSERLIGSCGFDGLRFGKSHRAEIGYWLARPFWSQGIMTDVVRTACDYAFEQFGLTKITAHVFDFNLASARVLEKCGFEQEGFLKGHFEKEGQLIDARLYGLMQART